MHRATQVELGSFVQFMIDSIHERQDGFSFTSRMMAWQTGSNPAAPLIGLLLLLNPVERTE